MSAAGSFADHYEAICPGACPQTPPEELKKMYFEKLRQFHPDKHPDSQGDLYNRTTQASNEAWEVLREPEKRAVYDASWRKEKEAALGPHERADLYRRRGNDFYSKARSRMKDENLQANFVAVQETAKCFKMAMDEYTRAIELSPCDHRLFSNRALCFQAVDNWAQSRDDARACTSLRPDFMKGWFLLARSLDKLGASADALLELENGLRSLPGNKDLLTFQMELLSGQASGYRRDAPSVSPACTPTVSRGPTPPPSGGPPGPGQAHRPVSPCLAAGGAASLRRHHSRSPGPAAAQTYGGPTRTPGSSRSPGAAARMPCPSAPPSSGLPRAGPCSLDASGTFHTGNFGAPTPMFSAAATSWLPCEPPAPPPLPGQRQSYSPGPNRSGHAGGQTYGGHTSTSRSPGPEYSSKSPGPSIEFHAGNRSLPRRSPSFRRLFGKG